jgi:hypothetical protein
MSLKIENSCRVAKSRPVCMDLKTQLLWVFTTMDLFIISVQLSIVLQLEL